MINNCTINDINRINELGNLINSNFSKVNKIEEIINNKNIIGYYLDNNLIGFIITEQSYEILDILYIVVDPLYRKKGIASLLMEHIINNKTYDKIMLEVRCDNNSAIKLYKKFNFKIINIRENYYNNMDAYVMEMIK